MADRDSLAIIIVTYNSRNEIGACLQSLIGHTDPFPTTITVVDNASTDGTADFVRMGFPAVRVIESGGNVGFARANNLGIRATDSDYVLLMNPDTEAPPGAIQTLVRGLAAHPEAAAAGARLLNERGFPELSWGEPITPWNELKRMLFSRLYHRKIRRIVRHVDRLSRQAREVPWVSGACIVIRRADLEAVGLLDERFFMYTEDVDLCITLGKRDRSVLYVAGAEVLHYRGRSAPHNPDLERLRQRSHVAYYEKHLPRWAPILRLYLKATGKL
ncbi:MAG TPA: glycosyltransferase family 2 protein [Vicinamibacterales bacterium]|nr:glycosyltransferase family 2 protein [Vicinamibacterales bacterium]